MTNLAPNTQVPDSALTREELYARLRTSSKQEVVLEEMQRLGFWPQDAQQPSPEASLIRREAELDKALSDLSGQLRGMENRDQALKTMRKERMALAKARREETKLKAAQDRHAHATAWHQRRQTEILYLGQGVSGGLSDAQSQAEQLTKHGLPPLHTAADLAQAMGVTLAELRFLAFNRQVSRISHYQRFSIAKKSGGERHISAPMPRLKRAQYWVLDQILMRVPVHKAVHGFLPGRSILTNAAPHVGQAVVINLDLKDFFPSISMPRVRGVFKQLGYSQQVATLLALLSTEAPTDEVAIDDQRYFVAQGQRVLPQGAPSSPMITNILCRRLDARLQASAAKLGFHYTRYADDLTFSADAQHSRHSAKLLWRVKQIIASEGLTLHPDKQQVMRRHQQQHVTGLVVNDKLSIDRETLRRFRAVLHLAESKGTQGLQWNGSANLREALLGYANFISMARPALGKAYAQRVKALQHHSAGLKAAPAASRLAGGTFRQLAAKAKAPWLGWWTPAVPAAPVLEKTSLQIKTERQAQRASVSAAATPKATSQEPIENHFTTESTAPTSKAVNFQLFLQAAMVMLAYLGSHHLFVLIMGLCLLVGNTVQRRPNWLIFLIGMVFARMVAKL